MKIQGSITGEQHEEQSLPLASISLELVVVIKPLFSTLYFHKWNQNIFRNTLWSINLLSYTPVGLHTESLRLNYW